MGQTGNQALIEKIKAQILESNEKAISFKTFMNLCLYDDHFGYYKQPKQRIGKQGDFYTSSALGTIMGECLAYAVAANIQEERVEHAEIQIVEWGGGRGQLARHMLDELASIDSDNYEKTSWIAIETSRFHRQQQEAALASHITKLRHMTESEWLKAPHSKGHRVYTVIIANELLDAFPVHRVRRAQARRIQEQFVVWNEEAQQFASEWRPLTDQKLDGILQRQQLPLSIEGQEAEVNIAAEEWIKKVARRLKRGCMFVIDYGDVQQEIIAEHRMLGTLLCYRKHVAHDDPLSEAGEQDITAHVNFTPLMTAAKEAGLNQVSLTTQKQFLIDAGILQQLQQHQFTDPFHLVAKKNRAIRQLLLSDRMSELFKVLTAHKK